MIVRTLCQGSPANQCITLLLGNTANQGFEHLALSNSRKKTRKTLRSQKPHVTNNPEQSETEQPASTDQPFRYDPELMRLYHRMKRTYRALMLDDDVDNQAMK